MRNAFHEIHLQFGHLALATRRAHERRDGGENQKQQSDRESDITAARPGDLGKAARRMFEAALPEPASATDPARVPLPLLPLTRGAAVHPIFAIGWSQSSQALQAAGHVPARP